MATDVDHDHLSLAEARKLREQTGELLERLLCDREQSEKRSIEAGKRDPMKFITGRTALDSAIASATEMISKMDHLLARLQSNGEPQPVLRRTQQRSGHKVRAPLKGQLQPAAITS